ncbi:molybdopterin-dependent oxidoreductase [Chitinophaga oryziterrae]|uniref:Molybdopterin-dependent oxidoreductase n=1 Tax=Chitinophaga oryziterrae TaxID=1031224 RepID=A0A6N8J3J9_9BACT|nr:molybdopterin-dependent oxidoreductase [Chitinophaga oryziterrae]MVT39785.1 molybdopterin-dependent oxidoreductase [Chitinophaga oryziterrae]
MKIKHLFRRKTLTVEQRIKRRNIISFAGFAVLYAGIYGSWRWLYNAPEEVAGITGGARKPLRAALNKTELAFRKVFDPKHLVKTYPASMGAKEVRQNGDIGIDTAPGPDWELLVTKQSGQELHISLNDLKALPKTDITFDFKCIEGWEQISHWAGVKFSDFIMHYHLEDHAKMQYVGLSTPDENYYVGIDMPSAMHPQTLLCYEMNGQPLPVENGYPLRLIIPVKYGVKHLKRIGSMVFSNERPPDYWAEQGYDYYTGL